MDRFDAMRIARLSGYVGKSYMGETIVEWHEWRRRQDIGKRRTTFGIYGTENEIRVGLKKANQNGEFRWNRFPDGKCMVW